MHVSQWRDRNDVRGFVMAVNSHRRVLSGDDGRVRVLVRGSISAAPSSFQEFFKPKFDATFVDKTLAIEAFLRYGLRHHLILRPRRCGKTYTLSMMKEFLECPQQEPVAPKDIMNSTFRGTMIAEDPHRNLVAKHFQQYPVLYIDLKDVKGATYEEMLNSFDRLVFKELDARGCYGDFKQEYRQHRGDYRNRVWEKLSNALKTAYSEDVIVLIDEYDAPMHVAIENGYADLASWFFSEVFGTLLKSNPAVCASMMVGICRTAKSGWLSELNNIQVFPMHAEDDRYAKFFLFTEKEVESLCDAHPSTLNIDLLRLHYNSYKARGGSGPVALFNPFSVITALERDQISNYWVDTGRHSVIADRLWRASEEFRSDLNRLITQECVKLNVDEQTNFKTLDTISDDGLWGLLYYTGYLAVDKFDELALSRCTFRIPNGEVKVEWHRWLKGHLDRTRGPSLLVDIYQILKEGDALKFQVTFTAFLQEHLSLFCVPRHKEKVYQALCFALFFGLFDASDCRYEVKMEQEDGHGRSDITAHPKIPGCVLSFVFEIKRVDTHNPKRGTKKRTLKSPDQLKEDLKSATDDALRQIKERDYRAGAPPGTRKIHEYALAFAGKFCLAAVCTLEREVDGGDWVEVKRGTANNISEADLQGLGDDDMNEDMDVDE